MGYTQRGWEHRGTLPGCPRSLTLLHLTGSLCPQLTPSLEMWGEKLAGTSAVEDLLCSGVSDLPVPFALRRLFCRSTPAACASLMQPRASSPRPPARQLLHTRHRICTANANVEVPTPNYCLCEQSCGARMGRESPRRAPAPRHLCRRLSTEKALEAELPYVAVQGL